MSTQYQTPRLYQIGLFAAFLAVVGGFYLFSTASHSGGTQDRSPENTRLTSQGSLQGQDAPDFELEQMNGETFRLSDHRGEVIVVNFWATWCPPCKKEIPGFVELQNEFGSEGVLFVGVSLDEGGFDAVRPFAEKMDINYPLVVDDGTVASKYGGVRALPTSFVVGPEGKIQYARPGFLPENVLREKLKPLLKKAEPRS